METVVEINGNGSEIVDEKENGRESSIAPVGMPNFDEDVLAIPRVHLGPGSLSIFKIPTILFKHKKDAYLPNGFSFGPWHYHKPHLQATREIKIRCLHDVLGRAPNPRDKLAELKEGVRKMVLEGWIHSCYAEEVELSSEQLVETLLLDGCFIIEVLHRRNLLQSGILFHYIYHDLILLENQIPWFVLNYLFGKVAKMDKDKRLVVLVIRIFAYIFSYDGLIVEGEILELEEHGIAHILDLLRKYMLLSNVSDFEQPGETSLWKRFVPKCLRPGRGTTTQRPSLGAENLREMEIGPPRSRVRDFEPEETSMWKYLGTERLRPAENLREMEIRLPSASRLKEAGIQFKRVRSRPMLDIRFRNGVLEVPSLSIHETTESLFRNLIAYEQCCSHYSTFASYAKLMDDLIDTVEDIEILSKSGVICNSLNPEDATQVFNLLCRDTYIGHGHFHYADIYRDVNSYCMRLWPRWRAFYIQNYFAKPWAVVSQIFALAILALTILQVLHK